MSGISDDEFGGYDPITPAKATVPKKAPARTAKASRPVAGPSKAKPTGASKTGGHHKNSTPIELDNSDHEVPEPLDDNEVVSLSPPTKAPANKAPANKPTRRAEPNGKTRTAAAKGKGKAEPPIDTRRQPSDDVMDIDEVDVVDNVEHTTSTTTTRNARKNSNAVGPGAENSLRTTNAKYEREIQRLREELQAVTEDKETLSKQLAEVFQIRMTEQEEAVGQLTETYEARLDTQAQLIKEMESQIRAMKAASDSGKAYMLQFMTREAADQEQKVIRQEIEQWKEVAKRKDALIAEKDREIEELRAHAKVIQSDLEAEIERGKTLVAKQAPVSTGRMQTRLPSAPVEDPKRALVIRMYEDMTNFLITGVKIENAEYLDLEEPTYSCVLSYEDDLMGQATLSFTLRLCYERAEDVDEDAPIRSKSQLVEKFRYSPRDLEKVPVEFVERLDFFKAPFMFSRDQLPVFLKQLTTTLESTQADPEDEGPVEDEDVVIVE